MIIIWQWFLPEYATLNTNFLHNLQANFKRIENIFFNAFLIENIPDNFHSFVSCILFKKKTLNPS